MPVMNQLSVAMLAAEAAGSKAKDARITELEGEIERLRAALLEIANLDLPDGSIYDAPKLASAALEKK